MPKASIFVIPYCNGQFKHARVLLELDQVGQVRERHPDQLILILATSKSFDLCVCNSSKYVKEEYLNKTFFLQLPKQINKQKL